MATPLLAPLLAAAVVAAAATVLAAQRWWQRRLVGTVLVGRPVGGAPFRAPDILYFTGKSCTVCHVAQRPALRRLRELVADVSITEIDVAVNTAAARSYRVMTLPTTVVLDRAGRTVALNAGFTPETVLRTQVDAARRSAGETAPT